MTFNNLMKRKSKVILLIMLVVLLVAVDVLFLIKNEKPSINTSSNITCTSDSDCVPEQCCHPTSCINSNYKMVCNLLCTQVCQGPLDCNAGSCGCINGKCAVVSNK